MPDDERKKPEENMPSSRGGDDESAKGASRSGRTDAPDEAAGRPNRGGPYRDARDVLLAKRRRVLASLAQAERAAEHASSLRRELEYVESSLRTSATPLLERVRIATPCRARWEDMAGDDVVRHCTRCGKDVYDFASMTTSEAEALLRRDGEGPCVRLRRRRDGRVVTADCPPPTWSERSGSRVAGAAGAAAVAIAGGALASFALSSSASPCETPSVVLTASSDDTLMGAVEGYGPTSAHGPWPTFEVSETTMASGWPGTTRFIPWNATDGSAGVKIYGVRRASALAEMGLRNGDLLLQVSDIRTETPADAIDALAAFQDRGEMTIWFERGRERAEHLVVLLTDPPDSPVDP